MIASLLGVYKFRNVVVIVGVAIAVLVGLPLAVRDTIRGRRDNKLLVLCLMIPVFCAITVNFLPYYCARHTFARLVDNSNASHVTIIGPHGEASTDQVAEILDALQQTGTHKDTYGSHERQLVVRFSQEPESEFFIQQDTHDKERFYVRHYCPAGSCGILGLRSKTLTHIVNKYALWTLEDK